jgi:hypothetical protein
MTDKIIWSEAASQTLENSGAIGPKLTLADSLAAYCWPA